MDNLRPNTENLSQIKTGLQTKPWLVACLCAAWCDTCTSYRTQFDALQAQHPDKCFAWIDIEDQAELVDAVDIVNFPTILIQHDDDIVFFGTMLPDASQVHRLLNTFEESLKDSEGQGKAVKYAVPDQDIPDDWSLRRLILQTA